MKVLFYVPIIHNSADLGSLAPDVLKRAKLDLGEVSWEEHTRRVKIFWEAIADYFKDIDVAGMKIYQDGMAAEGETGRLIVEAGALAGSYNHELVLKLLNCGAILVKTEEFQLVKEERDRLQAITQAKSLAQKLTAYLRYIFVKNRLLRKRDKFIAQRIKETLKENEKGILFIGAYHNIKNRLPKDIFIKEVKDIQKIRDYQNLLPFHNKKKEQFEELGEYLTSKIEASK